MYEQLDLLKYQLLRPLEIRRQMSFSCNFTDRFSTLLRLSVIALILVVSQQAVAQQDVRKLFTTYGGFWSSSADSLNTVKPDDSHLLLGFSYKNAIYSTGISDTALSNRKIDFTAATFQSFQLSNNFINVGSSTKIGVGTKYGGNGNVSPVPVVNDPAAYLTDGAQGLDLGTAVFNTPASMIRYNVTKIAASRISDGIPDILVTQVGAPPASTIRDTFRFEDSFGNVVGKALSVSMANISISGTGNWKFYDPGTPVTYNAGLQGDRPLRLMAFELTDFGLTAANIGQVARFVHRVSGESDQAFVAYNNTAFTAAVGRVLPVTLESFTARKSGNQAQLDWNVSAANKFSHFEVERTTGAAFETIGSVYPQSGKATGTFNFTDAQPANGTNYYRLKLIDLDGSFNYSAVQSLSFQTSANISVYPNPASAAIYVQSAGTDAIISLLSVSGSALPVAISTEGSRSRIDISNIPAGLYLVRIQDGVDVRTHRVMVNH